MLKENDPLASLINKELMDVPSAEFSDQLCHVSMTSYKVSYSVKYRKQERLGKIIMLVLVFFNLMMLYRLNPFNLSPVVSLSFLATGVAIGILFLWIHIQSSLKSLPISP